MTDQPSDPLSPSKKPDASGPNWVWVTLSMILTPAILSLVQIALYSIALSAAAADATADPSLVSGMTVEEEEAFVLLFALFGFIVGAFQGGINFYLAIAPAIWCSFAAWHSFFPSQRWIFAGANALISGGFCYYFATQVIGPHVPQTFTSFLIVGAGGALAGLVMGYGAAMTHPRNTPANSTPS